MQYIQAIVLGDSNVGKTCLAERFAGREFSHQPKTIGVDMTTRTMDNIHVKLWDASGQDRFLSLAEYHIRRVDAVIIVFDISNKKSFENVTLWLDRVKQMVSRQVSIYLVGNKCDMARAVPYENAELLSATLNTHYIETSCLEDINIDHLFDTIIQNIMNGEDLTRALMSPMSRQETMRTTHKEQTWLDTIFYVCTCQNSKPVYMEREPLIALVDNHEMM
ncbi:Ras-related protein Rab [Acrasis kona]|uniref:Ras-related protein Rab n=1 Tax=Acrasis kona TaxID=1008807 RepID=A0AAW2ZD06_9EUKA